MLVAARFFFSYGTQRYEKFIVVQFFSVTYPYTRRLLIAFPVIAIELIIGKFSFTDNKLTTV